MTVRKYCKPQADTASDDAKGKYAFYLFQTRIINRDREHPGWRQTYQDCVGLCQFPMPDGSICGEMSELEFHEPFGESKGVNGNHGSDSTKPPSLCDPQFQQRVLLCRFHHAICHVGRFLLKRANQSMVHTDVDVEIILAGGVKQWREKFGVIDR